MRTLTATAVACLTLGVAACSKPGEKSQSGQGAESQAPTLAPAISNLTIASSATVKDIMDDHVDPAGDFMFAAIMDIADESGVHHHEPRTPEQWEDVRQNLIVLHDAPIFLAQQGRRAARPEDRSKFPELELEPEGVNKLLDSKHADFVKHAKALQDAASEGLKAVDAKDAKALYGVIDRIDIACESCHLNFWYPNDERAKAAARRRGVY